MKYVALTGLAGSGKTKVARLLSENGIYLLANFTDQIKEKLAEDIGVTVEEITRNKDKYRDLLQKCATFYGFDTNPRWVMRALERSGWTEHTEHPMVYDNVRTDEQARAIRSLDIPIALLLVRPEVAYNRLNAGKVQSWMQHPSERGISYELIDLVVDGERPAEEVARAITRLPDMLSTPRSGRLLHPLWSVPTPDGYPDEALPGVLGGTD